MIETADFIKDQIRVNQDKLNNMDVVGTAVVINIDMSLENWKDLLKPQLYNHFKILGNCINRQDFGDVSFSVNDISKSLGYVKTESEAAAYFVAHKVVKQGVEIGQHINHKNRKINTITFGAPVELNGVRGNMAVIVKITGKNRYKAHRILTPDGKMFNF
ncbi:MAG: hypothetical protein LBC73_09270 [Oscillospiraceae bacterium]|nr:hypothetical protein [Oscillospiraceae bacterium]